MTDWKRARRDARAAIAAAVGRQSPPFHPDLVCSVSDLAYDFTTCTGKLKMPDNACCDMSACIELFTRIDRNVKRIDTFAGDKADTAYIRKRGNMWVAILENKMTEPYHFM
jgi:hypothetical protein